MLQERDRSVQDVLASLLRSRYGIQSLVLRYGYSLMYSLTQYFWDGDVELFSLVLNDEVRLSCWLGGC